MGLYFKIVDKRRTDGRVNVVKAPVGRQVLYSEIEDLVGDLPNPVNGIPHSIEVDSWGELAYVDEAYHADDFDVICISEEDYCDYMM